MDELEEQEQAALEEIIPYILCVERYRHPENTYEAEDYFVDGLVLIHLPLPQSTDRTELEGAIKKIILQFQSPAHEAEIKKTFPKFHALRTEVTLWWYHLMRKEHKEKLPQDFHTNQFTEDELLGIAVAEDPNGLTKEMWFDRDGDPIEGPPDRMMAFLYS